MFRFQYKTLLFLLTLFILHLLFIAPVYSAPPFGIVEEFSYPDDTSPAPGWEIINASCKFGATDCYYLIDDILNNDGTQAKWLVNNGHYGIHISPQQNLTITQTLPINWPDGLDDYAVEFDMHTKDTIFYDRNFVFRYQDENHWYDIHIYGQTIYLQKKATPGALLASQYYPFLSNVTYNFNIEVKQNNIKVFINDILIIDYSDNSVNPILSGRAGPQSGIKGSPGDVWFDNLVVTSLEEDEEPEWLDVPYFTQRNDGINNWWNQEYDFASLTNPLGFQEIEKWGCALTSAAMILKYHGFEYGPNGDETNPLTLNQYLKDVGGYNKVGSVIWPYIRHYAQEAKANGFVSPTLADLELSYSPYSTDLLAQDIEATNPGIIKIVMNDHNTQNPGDDDLHFVVGKGVADDGSVYINDPWDLEDTNTTLDANYGDKTYQKIIRFLKSNTNFSYFWLNIYSASANLLVEHNGQETGVDPDGVSHNEIPEAQYSQEGALASPDNSNVRFGGDENRSKLFILPKPETGSYSLTLSSDTSEFVDLEFHLFNKDGEPIVFEKQVFVSADNPSVFELEYQQDNQTDFASLTRVVTFETLRNDINALWETGDISHDWTIQSLLQMLKQAERYHPNKPNRVKHFLDLFEKQLNNHYPEYITDQAYQYLFASLNLLREAVQ